MATISRPPVSLLNPLHGLFPVSGNAGDVGDIHFRKHALDSDSDHEGRLAEDKIAFSPVSGHIHDGADSARLSHTDLVGIGVYTHAQLDNHIQNVGNPHQVTPFQIGALDGTKKIAVPQTEQSPVLLAASVYQVQAAAPIFVGRTGGVDPNSLVALLELDGARLMVGGVPVTIINITSDLAGTVSVLGNSYFAHPYIHLSATPNKTIRIRYGIESDFNTLPEALLLNEPLWVGETSADVRGWIADIKGGAYDAAVADNEDLKSLAQRVITLESSIDASTGANIVFKNNVISAINASIESATISLAKLDGILESQIVDGPVLARNGADESISGKWTFSNGPVIEHGTVFPAIAEDGRLFVKSDTKTLYVGDGAAWHRAGQSPRHVRVVGDGVRRQWMISDAVADNDSIWVFRNMLLQDKNIGHYTETQDGADVRITFPAPLPSGSVVVFKVF